MCVFAILGFRLLHLRFLGTVAPMKNGISQMPMGQ